MVRAPACCISVATGEMIRAQTCWISVATGQSSKHCNANWTCRIWMHNCCAGCMEFIFQFLSDDVLPWHPHQLLWRIKIMNLTLFKVLEFGNLKLSLGRCVQYQVEIERVLFRFYFQANRGFEGPAEVIAHGWAQKIQHEPKRGSITPNLKKFF